VYFYEYTAGNGRREDPQRGFTVPLVVRVVHCRHGFAAG
jgi:hypothetical protein